MDWEMTPQSFYSKIYSTQKKKKILYIFQTGHQTLKRGDLAKYNSFSSQV